MLKLDEGFVQMDGNYHFYSPSHSFSINVALHSGSGAY